MSIVFAAIFTVAVVVRVWVLLITSYWTITAKVALRSLRHTNRLAFLISATLLVWATLLSWDGDVSSKVHLALYVTLTVVGCIFSLMQLRSAALMVTVILIAPTAVMFLWSSKPAWS